MARKTSALAFRRTLQRDEREALRTAKNAQKALDKAAENHLQRTSDSYENLLAKMGVGQDNLLSGSTYGFNPITRLRTLLEWIHRGSWLGGVAIDVIADDMTRRGVEIMGGLEPKAKEAIENAAVKLNIWGEFADNVRWSRLYGGSIGVHLVVGQDLKTPLKIDTVQKGQYRGLLILDRWMLFPTLDDLVTEFGPNMGLPKFYDVGPFAPGLRGKRIHYTRCVRLEGIRLPYAQRVMENLWGESEYERLYDRMVIFDSATTGAGQLAFKQHLRFLAIKDLRNIVATGGDMYKGLLKQVEMMRRMQMSEGLTLIDAEDELQSMTPPTMAGLAELMIHLGQQVSGALQIPLVRLFGQSPSGLNSNGEGDLKNYYDGINQRQNSVLKVPVTETYQMLAQSAGIQVDDDFAVEFRPLWQMPEKEKAEVAKTDTDTVATAVEAGLVLPQTAMRQLREQGRKTGRWLGITDEEIASAEEAAPDAPTPTEVQAAEAKEGEEPGEPDTPAAGRKTGDADRPSIRNTRAAAMMRYHALPVRIETRQGDTRKGLGWSQNMPADYGFIDMGINGADGDSIDCYVGPSPESNNVYVVDQFDLAGKAFDEHKVMLGYHTAESALEDYMQGHHRSDRVFAAMTPFTMPMFRHWLQTADLTKPCSTGVQPR